MTKAAFRSPKPFGKCREESMKIVIITACLMLMLFAVPVQAQGQTVTAAQKAEIEKAVKEQMMKWYAAWDSLNPEAAKQVWSREKMIGSLRATGVLSDMEAILGGYKTTMENRKSNKVEVAEFVVYPFTPETALGISKGIWRVELKNGNIGNYDFAADSQVWVKEIGGWKLIHEAQRTAAQAPDPVNGTWELNLTKSKFDASTAPKSQTRTIEVAGEQIKYTSKGVDAAGKATSSQFSANFDGKDYPLIGSADSDTISLKRIDRFTHESIQKKAGKVVWRNRRVVSTDGKVMTITALSTNEKGETVTHILVFDKK
jgi:hypothetical protein